MASAIRDRQRASFTEARRAQLQQLARVTERGPGRIVRIAYEGFNRHNVMLWASGLTYTTSLSLVPILAVALSALKAFGGDALMRPLIQRFLAVNSPEIADRLLGFVTNINASRLGVVGGASLLLTVVLTLGTIERAFNHIFNAPRGRTWIRKFTDYLSLVFTLPLLIAAAVSLRFQVHANLPDLAPLGWVLATIPLWAGFTFLYLIFPNTRVRWNCALLGGLLAAILLEAGQWGYVHFQVGVARSQAIYGALAAIPIFLTWIYMAWVIVLVGAELAAAAQSADSGIVVDYRSGDFPRIAALLAVTRIAEAMRGGKAPACTARSLAEELNAPLPAVQAVIDQLTAAGLVHQVATKAAPADSVLMLSRDCGVLRVADVLAALGEDLADLSPPLAAVLQEMRTGEQGALASLTVADLVADAPHPAAAPDRAEWRLDE
ncbi:MAG TPA: YihY/virulence factor BrkB family protein [Candidatus Binataceae bacterium]|nr:YihY/virulence factor BrkB family protein [Candidatus Binataceae bacterium]